MKCQTLAHKKVEEAASLLKEGFRLNRPRRNSKTCKLLARLSGQPAQQVETFKATGKFIEVRFAGNKETIVVEPDSITFEITNGAKFRTKILPHRVMPTSERKS